MSTQADLNELKTLLKNGKPIPTALIRSISCSCEMLLVISRQQGEKIVKLEAELSAAKAQEAGK